MTLSSEELLLMLRDPNRESSEIAAAARVPRDEAARAARMVLGIAKVKPDEILALSPPLALALLRAAAGTRRAGLVASATRHPSKEVAKEAKRVAYLLRAQGVAVPEPQQTPPPRPVPPPEPPLPCFASTIDGHGERAIWIGRTVPGRGIEAAQAIVSDRKGLIELHIGMLSRKEYRTLARDIVARGVAMGIAEIPPQHARSLVAAARRLNAETRSPRPEGTDAWLSRLGPADAPPDPASGFSPLPEGEEQAAVRRSAQLHELPLLRGWLGDEDALRALAQKLDQIEVSELYLDARQREEAARAAIAEAVQAELSAERRALWASRLFSVAEHLVRSGDEENARVAAATARALRSGADAETVPFARLLVEKAFPEERPRVQPDPSSLLVTLPSRSLERG